MPKQTVQDVLNYAEHTNDKKHIILNIPNPGKPQQPQKAKLTTLKRKLFFTYLVETMNKTKAAAMVGVSPQAINDLLDRDQDFKAAYQYVIDYHLDNCEESMFVVASEPSRNGFNDRKLALQSLRPSTYGNKVEINKNQHVTIDMNIREMNQVLTGKPNVTPKVTSSSVDLESIELAEVE